METLAILVHKQQAFANHPFSCDFGIIQRDALCQRLTRYLWEVFFFLLLFCCGKQNINMQLTVVVPHPLRQLFFVIGWDVWLPKKEEFKRGNRICSGIWGMSAVIRQKKEGRRNGDGRSVSLKG